MINGAKNNVVIAGAAGVFVFALLLWWAPLKTKSPKTSVKNPKRVVIDRKIPSSMKNPPKKTPQKMKAQIDYDTRVKICEHRSRIDVDSKAFAELRQHFIAEDKNKDIKDRLLPAFDEFVSRTGEYCEDGKPKK